MMNPLHKPLTFIQVSVGPYRQKHLRLTLRQHIVESYLDLKTARFVFHAQLHAVRAASTTKSLAADRFGFSH